MQIERKEILVFYNSVREIGKFQFTKRSLKKKNHYVKRRIIKYREQKTTEYKSFKIAVMVVIKNKNYDNCEKVKRSGK